MPDGQGKVTFVWDADVQSTRPRGIGAETVDSATKGTRSGSRPSFVLASSIWTICEPCGFKFRGRRLPSRILRRCRANGLAVNVSVAIQVQPRFDFTDQLCLPVSAPQFDGLPGGGNGIVESTGGCVRGGQSVKVRGCSIGGELASPFGQGHRARRITEVAACR